VITLRRIMRERRGAGYGRLRVDARIAGSVERAGDEHTSRETQDVIKLGTGMLSVLASLVLGLLIATAKTASDATDTAVRSYAAELTVLDESLRDYGDGAVDARRHLRDYTYTLLHQAWGSHPFPHGRGEANAQMQHALEAIRGLVPATSDQRWLKDQALQQSASLLRQRWLLIERTGPSVRPGIMAILVSWIVVIFVSFGLNAPRNATVQMAFLVCALAIGSAIFIILQLDSPFSGLVPISTEPVETALANMLSAGQ
jgi:hypothetical protein